MSQIAIGIESWWRKLQLLRSQTPLPLGAKPNSIKRFVGKGGERQHLRQSDPGGQAVLDKRVLGGKHSLGRIGIRFGSRSGISANSGMTSNQTGTQTRTASSRKRITSAFFLWWLHVP